MSLTTIFSRAAPFLAGAALMLAQSIDPLVAQQPAQPMQQSQQPESPSDCIDVGEAGSPVVDEATARQHDDLVPREGRDLPEGELATEGTIAAPAAGALPPATAEGTGSRSPCLPENASEDRVENQEVLDSQPPGITELGRSPPNILQQESTPGLQQLIDRAHDGSTGITQPGGGTRGGAPR